MWASNLKKKQNCCERFAG